MIDINKYVTDRINAVLDSELIRLKKKAERAEKASQAYVSVVSEKIAIHEQFASIVESNMSLEDKAEDLAKLEVRNKAADAISKQDPIKVFDAETEAKMVVEEFKNQIYWIKRRS